MTKSNKKSFSPPFWLKNRHMQSILSLYVGASLSKFAWEEFELPDGDFIDLCWGGQPGQPIAVLLHGMEGSVYSSYIQSTMSFLVNNGWRVVLMHYRSCSGRLNRLSQTYHACHTSDFSYLLQSIRMRHPDSPIVAVGFSIGGVVLSHYLANHSCVLLDRAVAVSAPFELDKSMAQMPSFYSRYLLKQSKKKAIDKITAGQFMPATIDAVKHCSSFLEFNNLIIAPLFGFCDANDYYQQSNIRVLLRKITQPMLFILAKDDPLIPSATIPKKAELPDNVQMELCDRGGHLGFIESVFSRSSRSWLHYRIMDFLQMSTKTAKQPEGLIADEI